MWHHLFPTTLPPCHPFPSSFNNHRETEEFVKRALSVGVDFITVHGRTRRQKSTEPVSLEGMKLVKEVSTVPVLANGDVFTMQDANDIVAATGVDGTFLNS